MFTGIIEEKGIVKSALHQGHTIKLTMRADHILEDMRTGDSISVNGVCLTVTSFDRQSFTADVMPETFRGTALQQLKEGQGVNLERALKAEGRLGGHFVTGHVDTTGKILKKNAKENAVYVDISIPGSFGHLVILKGSIAIDGISLTVFGKTDEKVTVSLIPHTALETTLLLKEQGEQVNIEFDMLAKYMYSFFQKEKAGEMSMDFLQQNGFA